MKRRKLITVAALAALALACSESVGGMLEDAGQMLVDAGDAMTPDAGAQDTPAQCDKADGSFRWSEFPISSPGQTEVTICARGNAGASGAFKRAVCFRQLANWFEGTTTGWAGCSTDTTSITVHN